jgi:predicted Rossmann fold flavoprotein
MQYDTIIIGGGASGMMAGIVAARAGGRVLIIEKNASMGEKLKITGGGRCNIFNAEEDVRILLKNYGENQKYLHSPFAKFGTPETKNFFQEIGIEVKTEDRKRAFPISEKALDVYKALEKKLIENNVEIKLNSSVESLALASLPEGEGPRVGLKNVEYVKIKNDDKIYTAKKYILATGGYSHPETGSTGDGFKFLKSLNLGIDIVEPTPSLVPVTVSNEWVKKLTGKTVENLKMTFFVDGVKKKVLKYKKSIEQTEGYKNAVAGNRILFTHFGLSGPTILNASKEISDWLKEGEVVLSLDLFPQFDEKEFDKFLLNIFEENKNAVLQNILKKIYPGNILTEIFADNLPNLDLEKQVNDVRVSERKDVCRVLKNLPIAITGLMGFDKAIIADGGVNVDEVNFENMSLKKIPNLHITGDMLNINRPSGGYSLQLCWTTGYIAGN